MHIRRIYDGMDSSDPLEGLQTWCRSGAVLGRLSYVPLEYYESTLYMSMVFIHSRRTELAFFSFLTECELLRFSAYCIIKYEFKYFTGKLNSLDKLSLLVIGVRCVRD